MADNDNGTQNLFSYDVDGGKKVTAEEGKAGSPREEPSAEKPPARNRSLTRHGSKKTNING